MVLNGDTCSFMNNLDYIHVEDVNVVFMNVFYMALLSMLFGLKVNDMKFIVLLGSEISKEKRSV